MTSVNNDCKDSLNVHIDRNRVRLINIILMILFFTSTDTVLFGTNSNFSFLYVPRIVGAVACIFLPVCLNQGKIKVDKRFWICFLFVAIIGISGAINKGELNTVISRIIPVLVACTIASCCKLDEFASVFCKFIYIVAIFAFIIEGIAYVYPKLIYLMPSIYNTSGFRYANCFFGSIRISDMSKVLIRSNGIFWEPGAFAIYLNFAIFFHIIVLKKQRIFPLIVYLVALIFTFSTTGYICFAFLMLVYILFLNSNKSHLYLKRMVLVITFVLVVIVLTSSSIRTLVFGKIINQESTATVRWVSIWGGLKIALDSPIFGVFSNNINEAMKKVSEASGGMLTNTLIYQFAAYGIPFGSLFTLYSYKFFKKLNVNNLAACGLFAFLLMSYIGEMFYSFLPFVFVFYGLRNQNENSTN